MENGPATYHVACCTPGCTWEIHCATHIEAQRAGREHEEMHDAHVTAIFPLNGTSKAA